MGSDFGKLNNLVWLYEEDIKCEEFFDLPKSDPNKESQNGGPRGETETRMNSDLGLMRGKSSLKKKITRRKKRRGKMNNRGGTRSAEKKSREIRKKMPTQLFGIL